MKFKKGDSVGIVGKSNVYCGYKGKVIGAYNMMGSIVYVVRVGVSTDYLDMDCMAQELVKVTKGGVAK